MRLTAFSGLFMVILATMGVSWAGTSKKAKYPVEVEGLGDIERDEDGNVLHLTKDQADKHCLAKSNKKDLYILPPLVVLEKDYEKWSSSDYLFSTDELRKYWYWSSSPVPNYSDNFFAMGGRDGIGVRSERTYTSHFSATRCLRVPRGG